MVALIQKKNCAFCLGFCFLAVFFSFCFCSCDIFWMWILISFSAHFWILVVFFDIPGFLLSGGFDLLGEYFALLWRAGFLLGLFEVGSWMYYLFLLSYEFWRFGGDGRGGYVYVKYFYPGGDVFRCGNLSSFWV